jgi:XTP/dITP diphosphohydrolase
MAAPLRRLVVASSNAGKLRELRALASSLAAEIVPQSDLGVAAVAETGSSFLANALLKAQHAARATGSAALADDSGLEVDALGGAPGVYSARYAGEGASDADNIARLLGALDGVPPPRRARYHAVLVLVVGPDDPAPLVAEGRWEGRIATVARGGGGFGYDPVFLPGDGPRSVAELSPEEKNRLSHRARALEALLAAWRARP